MSVGPLRLDDCRCVACSGPNLSGPAAADSNVVLQRAIRCADCGASYDVVWGVPFLGRYEPDDILGLIEIAANIVNRGKFGVTPEVVEQWEENLANYHAAPEKDEFLAANPQANSPFLLNRYGEWQELHSLTSNLDLNGRTVLDVGAGLGFDSHRLSLRGAKVTALEFSPILSEAGAQNFPCIRWIGGFAHALPFQTASFDAVFCNAALHHMRDIPAAIGECLRVLKPGGHLITTCDSFRANNSSEDFELKIFDNDPTVLMGVNERIPRLAEFVSPLLENRERIDVEIFTHTLYNALSNEGGTCTLDTITPWDIDRDIEMLEQRSGSLALKVRLTKPWEKSPVKQTDGILDAGEFAPSLTDESSALAHLAAFIPKSCVNLVFPGKVGTKFEMLNGWRLPQGGKSFRIAYRRGRWFLRRRASQTELNFQIMTHANTTPDDREIAVLINGSKALEFRPTPGEFHPVLLDLSGAPPDLTFALEIRLVTDVVDLEAGSFKVRNRQFGGTEASLMERAKSIGQAFAKMWVH